ncbi:hypothetical protein DQ04_02991060 [Trypanosoma grayi]|uniref:hypothetical protein n=1 Tax=Trypanosoma grayi TaxID=71804 RepID=UPI0004F48B3D|nr:hypothetical protein DQ04_02991060 [Trypanosoma grayi]KEG11090.1 hypothetical protein DQ04_02991060 [Trypanosoma grayi]
MRPTRWTQQARLLGCLRALPFAASSFRTTTCMTLSSSTMPWKASADVGALRHSMRFTSAKLARLYTLELNRVRSEYRRSPTKAQQEECLRAITETPLHRIQGVDGKTVAHCLSTLVVLDAPHDMPLLHDCAVWLSVHPDAFSPHALAQSLYALVCLGYPDTTNVVRAVQKQALSAASDMAPSSLCMLLAAVLTACAGADGAAQGVVDVSQKLSDRVLRVLGEGLGLTEKVMIAVALGKLLAHTVPHGLLAEDALQQISASVWASVPGAELAVVSLADLVGLVAAVHTAPQSIRESAEAALLEELKRRVEAQPLVSARSAVQVSGALRHVVRSTHPSAGAVLQTLVDALEAHIGTDAVTLGAATKMLAEFAAVEEAGIATPPSLMRYLVQAINEGREKWNAESVHIVLRVFARKETLRADAQALAAHRVELIQAKCGATAPVDASEIAALLVEGIVDPHAEVLAAAVANNIGRWSVSNALTFLRAAAEVDGKPTRAIMRDVASKLVPYMEKATAAQLAAVMSSYGRARVRNDAFCAAITDRTAQLASELTLHQVSSILGGLAAVEYRDTKLFVDLAPLVIAQAHTADVAQTASLLASFAKMLVWNFKVIWTLAERAAVIHDQFTLPQILAVVMSLNRMDVQHQSLMDAFLQNVMRYVSRTDTTISLAETVMILSAFSRSGLWDAAFFESLGKRVVAEQEKLTPDELAETLMAFARVGLTQYNIFEELTLCTLSMAPTSPLMPLAHITVAYALVACRHEELFSIIADRFVNQKADVPAVTIASVLSAFASVGVRNDRLFIEAIPRVRHVGQYGTPKDITNVVYAYSQVGLWHYKLFVRLADRAIQLRGEFRCDHLARLLEGYARVDMRYEKLFVEFSPRVQTISHLLTAGELTRIVSAYAKIEVPDAAVFKACGDRAVELADHFEQEEAQQLLTAFHRAKIGHDGVKAVFMKKFPEAVAAAAVARMDEEDVAEMEDEGKETHAAGSASAAGARVEDGNAAEESGRGVSAQMAGA